MRAYYCDDFVLPLPVGHRFPMSKYALLRERILTQRIVSPSRLHVPQAASDEQILTVHDLDYWMRVQRGELAAPELRRLGFPWSSALVERARRSVGGTLAACRAALDEGRAVNLAGGTHHAFRDCGRGFCVLNDAAIAARWLQRSGRIRRALIIDCDVHQGDGTAHLFRDDTSVFTLSVHGASNYPLRKQRSDLDVALPDRTTDLPYLDALGAAMAAAFVGFRPDLAIYLAGADPYKLDRWGRLALSKAGLEERDRLVLAACRQRGVPIAGVMAGGYAECVEDLVDIHAQTVAAFAAG